MSGEFGLPKPLEISAVRQNGMPAVRRTVIHGSTSQQSYGPGELVHIPVETGAAGSFFMVETSRLDMDVNVWNKNLFVDFLNLPRCGWHALIEEFGIEVHNSMHDNQRFYGEMINLEMIRNGENMTPCEMTISNPYEVGGGLAGELHPNLIKPSMITLAGLPHGVRYQTMSQPSSSNVSSSVPNIIMEGLILNSHSHLKKPYGRNGYGTIPQVNIYPNTANIPQNDNYAGTTSERLQTAGYVGGSVGATNLQNQFAWWAETSLPCSSSYDDRILTSIKRNYNTVTGAHTVIATTPANLTAKLAIHRGLVGDAAIPASTANADTTSADGMDSQIFTSSRFYGTATSGNEVRRYAFTFPRVGPYGTVYADNTMFDVAYGQTLGGATPMMWPAKQPTNLEAFFKRIKKCGINTKSVHNYSANCKNIPISVPLDLSGDPTGRTAIWGGGTDVHTVPTHTDPRGAKYCFRVSLKLYSCLLGVFAQRWFPSLLIQAGRMRIRLRLQQPNVCFQTLMDPCRIVPGTARDRFPYLGVLQKTTTGLYRSLGTLTQAPIDTLCHGIHPIMVQNYVPGICYNDLVALGKFPIPQTKMQMNRPVNSLHASLVHMDGASLRTTPARYSATGTSHGGGAGTVPNLRREFLSIAPLEQQSGEYNFRTWGSAHDASGAGGDGAATDGVAVATYVNQTVGRKVDALVKVLTNAFDDLHQNVTFGYPAKKLVQLSADGTQRTNIDTSNLGRDQWDEFLRDPRIREEPVGDTDSIFCFQNFNHQSSYGAFFSDGGYTAAKKGYLPDVTWGDWSTEQRIFPARIRANAEPTSDFALNGLNWEIYAPPQPQYVPTLRPWDKRETRFITAADIANENQLCYGTHLKESVAQVRRTNRSLFPLSMDSEHCPTINERVTYTVSNIAYRVEEIILPEAASMNIIAAAMEGGITIEADTIKSVEQILPKQANQKILINVSAGIVNDICFVFQPTAMIQGDQSYGYNSYAFYSPFASFTFEKQSTGTLDADRGNAQVQAPPNSADTYNSLGGDPVYYNAMVHGPSIGIKTFLSISTEYFPRNPIDDLQTLIDHVTWGDQRRGDIEYLELGPHIHNSYDSNNFCVVSPFQDGFFSVFTPIECLDDQTITDNPFWTPLECNIQRLIRGKRAKGNALPFYKPLEGTFHLSFNLQAFMGQHDTMNVGTPMVNNNAYLQMENCHLMLAHETRMLVFARVFARIVIERGGIIQVFT